VLCQKHVSIHDALTSIDRPEQPNADQAAFFNPRCPHEHRRYSLLSFCLCCSISIHDALTSIDYLFVEPEYPDMMFQSTTPSRASTENGIVKFNGDTFQSTTPSRASTKSANIQPRRFMFQSTMPSRASTAKTHNHQEKMLSSSSHHVQPFQNSAYQRLYI